MAGIYLCMSNRTNEASRPQNQHDWAQIVRQFRLASSL
jgi:hypothetical protein